MDPQQRPDRNLAMELVRVTEAAALAASKWIGLGKKNEADGAATDDGHLWTRTGKGIWVANSGLPSLVLSRQVPWV